MEYLQQDTDNYAAYVYKFLLQYVKITERDFNDFLPFLEVRSFAKRLELLPEGQTENYLSLIVKGLARKYVIAGKNEKTLQIATEGHLIQSEISFHTRMPSAVIIETLEPTVMVSISYDNVQLALKEIPLAEEIGRKLMTYMFIKKDARYFSQLNTSTRQRFLNYLNNHPHMLQRVPQKILASYLEIKPETFSRLKHLLKN